MGRADSYGRQEVIRRALGLFSARAFHSISIQELVEATSLNRFAIYEKFGGKRQLFDACLELHLEVLLPALLAPLEAPSANFQEILNFLDRLRANNRNPEIPVGCIVVNASLEFGGCDDGIERIHEACRAALRRGFARALQRAEDRGELAPGRLVAQRAEYLQTMISAFTALQHASRPAAEDLMRATVDELSSWRRAAADDGASERPR